MLTYIIQVNLFSILILCFILLNIKKIPKMRSYSEIYFKMLVLSNILLLCLDFSVDILNGLPNPLYGFLLYIAASLLYIFIPLPTLIWFLYIDYYIFNEKKRIQKFAFYLLIPLMINLILTGINLFIPISFYIHPGNIYERGPLFLPIAALSFGYVFYAFGHLLRHRKRLRKNDLKLFYLFSLPTLVGGALQTFIYGLLTVWPGLSLSVLLLYLFIQSRSAQIDYLTGLFTRREFDYQLALLSKKELSDIKIGLVIMDFDGLKIINDTYGHHVGDNALKDVGRILKKHFKLDDLIARLGGDEFGIIMNIKHENELEVAINRLETYLKDHTLQTHDVYRVSLSIGYGVYDEKISYSIEDYVKILDQKMYKNKQIKKDNV